MKSKITFFFLGFVLVSCSVIDIKHSYKSTPNWKSTGGGIRYDPYYIQTGFNFTQILNGQDTITIDFFQNLQPLLVGLPIAPIIPNLFPLSDGLSDDGFNLHIKSSNFCSLDLSKIKIYGISTNGQEIISSYRIGDHVFRNNRVFDTLRNVIKSDSKDSILLSGKSSFAYISVNKSRFHIKCLVIQINGLEIDGVQQSVPPLLLSRKRKLMYRPLIHPFMFR